MIPPIDYINALVLCRSCGSGREGDRCAMQELRSWLSLDPSKDAIPDCVSSVIGSFVIRIQDARPEWRAQIPPILPLLISSKGDDALERRRIFRCADWAVRTALLSVFPDSKELLALPPIVDEKTAQRAAKVCHKIYFAAALRARLDGTVATIASAASDAGECADLARVRAKLHARRAAHFAARTARTAAIAKSNIDPIAFVKELLSLK